MLTLQQFIDGRFVDPASRRWFDKADPATGRVIAHVPDGDSPDVDAAAEAAARAFPRWSRTPVAERARLLLAIADCIDARHEGGGAGAALLHGAEDRVHQVFDGGVKGEKQ